MLTNAFTCCTAAVIDAMSHEVHYGQIEAFEAVGK